MRQIDFCRHLPLARGVLPLHAQDLNIPITGYSEGVFSFDLKEKTESEQRGKQGRLDYHMGEDARAGGKRYAR